MDSLTLYLNKLSQYSNPYYSPNEKLLQLREVFNEVCNELNKKPFKLKNSPFIAETLKNIKNCEYFNVKWNTQNIGMVDAYIVIYGVNKFFTISNYEFSNDEDVQTYKQYFFSKENYSEYENNFIKKIKSFIEEITSRFSEKPSQDFGYGTNHQTNQFRAVTTQNFNTQYSLRKNQDAPPVAIPTKSQEKTATSAETENYSAKNTFDDKKIEFQKFVVEAENKRTERANIRSKDNKIKINQWYAEQENIVEQVKKLQDPTQKLLTDFRAFNNNLTENYILKFANLLIELFNSIADNYDSHKNKAQNSQDQDYYNAVENYKDYMEDIKDALADFGVEEISSDPGTKFEGKIHLAKNTKNFSPQTATIKKSLRSGFRYQKNVLQKETVEV